MQLNNASHAVAFLQTMRVSAVLATVGGADKVERLRQVLETLDQLDEVCEIVLVWQGEPDSPLIPNGHKGLRVILSGTKALSHARNVGAKFATSEWLWFLDDDTVPIGADYLKRAATYLVTHGCQFATANVRTVGTITVATRTKQTFFYDDPRSARLLWEPGLLIPRNIFLQFRFDEHLGVGCLHGSSEGYDLGIRLIAAGIRGFRHVDLELDHPPLVLSQAFGNRIAFYSFGEALVMIRYRLYGRYVILLAKTIAKMIVNAARLRRREAVWNVIKLWALLLGPLLRPEPPFVIGALPRERRLVEAPELSGTP